MLIVRYRVCFIKREHFLIKKRRREVTIASPTTPPLTPGACSLLTEPGLRSWAGMTRVSGSGEERTLSCHSKCGCVAAGACGFLAAECLTCTEVTPAHLVDQVGNQIEIISTGVHVSNFRNPCKQIQRSSYNSEELQACYRGLV